MEQILSWKKDWVWFFSGLANGFPKELWHEWVIPNEPKVQTHPVLLNERKKIPIVVKRRERASGGFLPERKTWFRLLAARTPHELRAACKSSRYWVRKDSRMQDYKISYYLTLVCDPRLALLFLAAKQEKRYAKSERPTSEGKRIIFLARAMAGACCGIAPRYSNEVLKIAD